MRRTTAICFATALLVSALAGCGGGTSSDMQPAGTARAGAAMTTAASSDGGSGSAKAPYTDAEACAWLKQNLPDIKAVGSEVGAMAQLTIGLASFFEKHGGLENADGYAYDEATLRGCKDLHDEAVKAAGVTSFGNL